MSDEIIQPQVEGIESKPKIYPTAPDADGAFFETDADEAMGIITKEYENGNRIKRCLLPQSKKVAQVRELKGKDLVTVQRYMGGNSELYLAGSIAVSTTIDGQQQTLEFFSELKFKDYGRINAMVQSLNFQ